MIIKYTDHKVQQDHKVSYVDNLTLSEISFRTIKKCYNLYYLIQQHFFLNNIKTW